MHPGPSRVSLRSTRATRLSKRRAQRPGSGAIGALGFAPPRHYPLRSPPARMLRMRAFLLVLALLMLVAGGLIAAGMLSLPREKEVLRLGGAALSVTQQRKPDARIGYGLLLVGAAVGAIALSRKR